MSKIINGARMAAMAAAFATSGVAFAADMPAGNMGAGAAGTANEMVHCYGVTACKGHADCKTATNDCKGMNSCKGQGFKAMKASECRDAKGTIGDAK